MRDKGMPDHKTTAPGVVVAVGASAADADPVERFLEAFHLGEQCCVVIILQNREALDEEHFREKLRGAGRDLTPIADGAPL